MKIQNFEEFKTINESNSDIKKIKFLFDEIRVDIKTDDKFIHLKKILDKLEKECIKNEEDEKENIINQLQEIKTKLSGSDSSFKEASNKVLSIIGLFSTINNKLSDHKLSGEYNLDLAKKHFENNI